jgi:hypothetical protein
MRDRSESSLIDSKQQQSSSYQFNSRIRSDNKDRSRSRGRGRGVDATKHSPRQFSHQQQQQQSSQVTIIEEKDNHDTLANPPREPPKLITVLNPAYSTEPILYELSEGGREEEIISNTTTTITNNNNNKNHQLSDRKSTNNLKLREVSRSRDREIDSLLGLPKMSTTMPTIAPSVLSKASNRTRQSFSSLNACGSKLHDHLHLQQTEASAQKLVYPALRQSYPFTPATALSGTVGILSSSSSAPVNANGGAESLNLNRRSMTPRSTPTSALPVAVRRHWSNELAKKKK